MTKRLFTFFSFVICFNSFAITHSECEEVKEKLLNNLDVIDNRVATISNIVATALDAIGFDSGSYTKYISDGVEHPTTTYLIPIYDSNGNAIGTIGSLVLTPLESISQSNLEISRRSSDMRALIQSIHCDDSTNGCQCADQLAVISANVDSINQNVSLIYLDSIDWYVSIYGLIDTWGNLWLEDSEFYHSEFGKIDNFLSLYTNRIFRSFFSDSGFSQLPTTTTSDLGVLGRFNILDENLSRISRTINTRRSGSSNFQNLLYQYGQYVPTALAVLNRWSNAHWLQLNQLTNSVVSVETNVSEVSSRFSIFTDFVFSSDTPLSMYTDQLTDGSYHDYLTNYYIKVSKGQQSGSDNYTNWFSRIEILLASLVFQDDGTNFVDEAENTTQMENTLSQSVDTLSQAVSLPQNVTGKIDNMGQSFLGLLEEWRTIVVGNSLPSQFVLCDINLTSQNRSSSSNSSLSSFRLETSLDSGEFRQFLDFCHAVTTILFTMLFVWLSIMLLSFLLASLAKLAKFCYMVYSALFGG